MVAIPEKTPSHQAFENGKEVFTNLVQVYNIVIAGLKEIEEHEPEKCAEWLKESAYPLDNQQMVELLFFMQEVLDAMSDQLK
jgi:hypothetical protein